MIMRAFSIPPRPASGAAPAVIVSICFAVLALLLPASLRAQSQQIVWTDHEKPIAVQIGHLRDLPDDTRPGATKQLAMRIRQLPVGPHKVILANALASLSTEGDFGHGTLQEVATTLASALREQPVPLNHGQPAPPYIELAQLAHFEHVEVSLNDPQFQAAMSKIEADDVRRQHADFTLADLHGKPWALGELRGKVVLVNFWATWCPPCRKEMPDLNMLYDRFKDQGFVVLAISDEDVSKVQPFIAERKIGYPILLDPGRKVNELFQIEGIPKSFVYDRSGNLVAESIDMRTQKQFLEMLAQAGLK